MREVRKRISHHAGIAKPEAAWDDWVYFSEVVIDDTMDTILQIESMREGSARVTAEFMRDAIDPLETVGQILDQRAKS